MTREKCLDVFRKTRAPAMGIDKDARVVLWNEGAERLFGLPQEEALGKPCYDVVDGNDCFGNRYCGRNCPILGMWASSMPVNPAEIVTCGGAGDRTTGMISLDVPATNGPMLVHIFHPRSATRANALPQVQQPNVPLLTDRERQVLRHLSDATPTAEIARELKLSVSTVRSHIQHLLDKLGASGRLEAVLLAQRLGLL